MEAGKGERAMDIKCLKRLDFDGTCELILDYSADPSEI
jgi:hypothetical protein